MTHTHMLDATRVTETSFGTLTVMLLVQLLPGVGKEMFSGKCLTTMDSQKRENHQGQFKDGGIRGLLGSVQHGSQRRVDKLPLPMAELVLGYGNKEWQVAFNFFFQVKYHSKVHRDPRHSV